MKSTMQFGVCCGPDMTSIAAGASFDYAEWSVGALLKPREPESAFLESLAAVRAASLPFPAVNCFVPGDLKITGPDADLSTLRKYVATTFERAERAGVEIIVFGSGGARAIPDGFDRGAARGQLLEFCAMLSPVAGNHGVTVVIEPLQRAECNVLNSVSECAALVREVGHPALRLLADSYHMMCDNDPFDDIVPNGDILAHVHIATVPNRLAPGAEPCDFTLFFNALAKAGYNGRVSIEGNIPAPEKDLPGAYSLMNLQWPP